MAGNAGAQQGGRPGYETIVMLVLMFAIFYFLLIRPQQKRAKQHKQLLESLKIGDQVVTAGDSRKSGGASGKCHYLGGGERGADEI